MKTNDHALEMQSVYGGLWCTIMSLMNMQPFPVFFPNLDGPRDPSMV